MNKQDNNIWVGVEDLSNDPQFLESAKQEFFELPIADAMSQDAEVIEDATKGSSRRDFLKYAGFSLTAATIAASCEIPVKKAIPYVVKPDAIVPGVAAYYASTYVRGGDYCSILVKTREGRPIKIEGNTMSSVTKGGTSARVQASVLDLYDTARLRQPASVKGEATTKMTWGKLDKAAKAAFAKASQIRIVANTLMSPSMKAAIADFTAAYPNTQVVTYDPVSVSGLLDANEASFGKRVVPSYHFDKAEKIVSFGADFLGTWISPVEYASDFAKGRKGDSYKTLKMSRLYQFESYMSLTGSNADNRVLVKPSEMGAATIALYNEVAKKAGQGTISGAKLSNAKATKAIKEIANDLWASKGKSLVVSGSNDVNEQTVVNGINNMLSSYGSTIDFGAYSNQRQGSDAAIQALVKDMKGGKVGAVIVYGDANPAYDLPNSADFVAGMKKVDFSVSLNTMFNETSAACNHVAPDHHFLEAWGDVEPKNGSFSLVQPTISPLFNTRSGLTSMLTWASSSAVASQTVVTEAATDSTAAVTEVTAKETPEYDYIKNYWKTNIFSKQSQFSTFQAFWDATLHAGVIDLSVASDGGSFAGDASSAAAKVAKPAGEGLEVAFYETVNIGNGQYANNPWLQEMPDPITRTVWDSVLCIPVNWNGAKAYKSLNSLKDGDVAELTINGKAVQLTVVRMFGMKNDTVAIALGYGRSVDGPVGKETGVNMYPLLSNKGGVTSYYATGATLSNKKATDKDFACVQHHHTMGLTTMGEDGSLRKTEDGENFHVDEEVLAYQGTLANRSVIRQGNLSTLTETVEHLKEQREEFQTLNSHTLYPGYDKFYKQGHHWSLSVDLSACIGCGACQVACIAENNVPVVGQHEVSIHHEMSWLRIDRYYYGDAENPNVVYQPMMCQHCDNAPCENVCPVGATNHSSEGLNQMTYNRCIGTRYCANNCPYKVRRFNWLDYTTADLFPWNEPTLKDGDEVAFGADQLTRMVLNPDVTVRTRGVIEKCSFCVQRIQETKLTAKVEQRKIRDGELKSACQTACPTGAIVFGDDNDPNSVVSKNIADERTYQVLEEVNTAPSVNYMMKILNRNDKLA